MKKVVSILCIMIISGSCFSQAPVIQWQKTYGGSSNEDAYSIQITKDGGYIIAGPSQSNDSEVTGNHGNIDYWVVKVDDTGFLQWETSLGGSGDDNSYSIAQTQDLGYIVAGGTSTFPASGDVTCTVAEWDYWLAKLSPAGAIEWTSCFGGSSYNVARSVQQTTDLSYIVAGESYSNDSDVTGNHGGDDYWVIKVSASGGLLWEKSLGGSGMDRGESVQQTTDGGYIVGGTSTSDDFQVTGNHGGSDYWVVKLDDTGAIQWEKSLGGSGEEACHAVQQTFDGGYIVAGSSNSNDFQVTGNHGGYDYWVVKLDDTGAIQWEISLGGAGNENCYSIKQTADSGYIVCGSTDSSSGQVSNTKGGDDYWMVKLSSTGIFQWQKSLGGSGTDVAYSVQQTTDNGYIVAGETNSTNGDITKNFGLYDFWVVKLSVCVLDSPAIIATGDTLNAPATYATYQWDLNGNPIAGATNGNYVATVNGTYELLVADTSGCAGISSSVVVSGLAVSSLLNTATITIWPNPTSDVIYITGAGPENVSIYNMVGQKITEAEHTEHISVSTLTAGLYFIKVSDSNGTILKQDKIVKE